MKSVIKLIEMIILDVRPLMEWIPAITNHLYWSIQSSDGNPEALVERYTSVIHHITNCHEFLGKYYTKCEHSPYEQEEGSCSSWLKMEILHMLR